MQRDNAQMRFPVRHLTADTAFSVAACVAACGSVALAFGASARCAELIVLCVLLAYVAWVDVRRRIIPHVAVAAILLVRAAFIAAGMASGAGCELLRQSVVAALAVSVPPLVIALCLEAATGRSALGGGDVKLLFAVGSCFCWRTALSGLLLACVIGALLGLARIARARGGQDSTFPFAPAIAGGFWLAALVVP